MKLEMGRGLGVLRVEAGSMAGRKRVVGLGFVAGRAKSRRQCERPHPSRGELQRWVEVGVIRTVGVRGRAGRGSRSCR